MQVSFHGQMGGPERDLKGLTFAKGRGSELAASARGAHNSILLDFPPHADPSPKDYASLCDWTFEAGFFFSERDLFEMSKWNLLAISLLQLFLSRQPNDSSAWDPEAYSWLSSIHLGFWNDQEQHHSRNIWCVICAPTITLGRTEIFSVPMVSSCFSFFLKADFLYS